MEDWVLRGMQRWPNVPALYDWLDLDRRGRWLIRGEVISRQQIIDVINHNYAADERGCWYFQNGPQRGYIKLEHTPFMLHVIPDDAALFTHTGLKVEYPSRAFIDEEGALLLMTEHGPGALIDTDLSWALQQLSVSDEPINEQQIIETLELPSGRMTVIKWDVQTIKLPLQRLNFADAPLELNFVRNPAP